LNAVNAIEEAAFYERQTKQTHPLAVAALDNPMIEEAQDFADIIENKDDPKQGQRYEEWVELARSVNETVALMRKQAGIVFDADKK